MPRYLTVFFDLGVAEQELQGAQVAGTAIDQGRLGAPQGVGAE